jgi:hypothetical protein
MMADLHCGNANWICLKTSLVFGDVAVGCQNHSYPARQIRRLG